MCEEFNNYLSEFNNYLSEFNNYLSEFNNYNKYIVYKFNKTSGGVGDLTKFFMYLLNICIKQKIRLYYLNTENIINKYLKIIEKFYINNHQLSNTSIINNESDIYNLSPNIYYIIEPYVFYSNFSYELLNINFNNIFYFDDEIINNSKNIINNSSDYISIHLRLGDTYLETDKNFIPCYGEKREFNENNIYEFIQNNYDKTIIFFCENSIYRNKIKQLFNKIIITKLNIGHTGLINTSDKQVKDTITEYYILINSSHIYAASISGFSITASKFNNVPYSKI